MTSPARANARNRRVAFFAAALLLATTGCEKPPAAPAKASTANPQTIETGAKRPLRIAVSIPPLAGIVKPLLPEGSELTVLLAPGRSEHGFEFTPKELAALGRADVVVYVGLGLEPQIERFLARDSRAPRQAFCLAAALHITTEPDAEPDAAPADAHNHQHDGEHKHDADHHHAIDPHLWLDCELVRQAIPSLRQCISKAIAGIQPGADEAKLAAAESKLLAEVDQIDRAYRTRLEPFRGQSIITHHAAFGRLAARYGLRVAEVIRPLESSEPTPGQLAEVVGAIKKQNVRAIFVEPQFNPEAARRIAEAAGVRLGTLDPLGDGDWAAMMRRNLDELVAKLGGT